MDPPQGPPTAGGAPPSAAVVDVPVGGSPNAGDVSAMISATIPSKRKRIPKQFFEAPAAAAAPPAAAPPAAKKGGRMKTKAAGPRGAPQSKVKTKAVSRIGLASPPSSKATAPPPSVPSDAAPAPPPPTMDVDKVFNVESTTSYMDMLNESTVDLDAGIDAFDGEGNVEEIDDEEEDEGDEEVVEEDQLKRFIESKARKRQTARGTSANRPEETDPWADPDSFSHLPTKCPIPPAGTKAADKITALPGQPPRVNFDQYSVANVIFLESPAGVGFSYASNDKNNNDNVGDRRTAEDTFVFLLHWLERFPEYKGRDFYIAGESYGGHYVPQLATVIKFMNELHGTTFMNLRGIFVGNPYLDDYKNEKGNLEFLWSHGVISDEGWAGILANCTFSPSDDWQCFVASRRPQRGDLDPYNIYAPLCLHAPHTGIYYSSSYLAGYDPCAPHYVKTYLNNLEVQQALHTRPNTRWSACNGDMDSACSITATRYSVKDLDLPVTKPWRPWYTPDSEVGGYVQQYEGGFTFASVRGAGHTVPTYQPKRVLVLLYSFLKGMLPPDDVPN
ncbi:hypothetical protein ACQ4PT_014033 [Festuca glaucescens]